MKAKELEHGDAKRREPLTRERIVRTALRVMDAEGLEAVSMRRIGRELGVEAMSLYNHVEDKEDILDGICELVMSEFEFPEPAVDWAESARRAARSWRSLLRAHPGVMRLFAEERGPVRSIESMKPMEFALKLLRQAGLSDRDTAQAFHAFGGYIQGFVMMELGSIAGGATKAHLDQYEQLADALPAEFATLRDVHRYFAECGADEQFEFGLDLLIRGVLQRVEGSSQPEPSGSAG